MTTISLDANARNYALYAPQRNVSSTAVFTQVDTRVTSAGDTRVTSQGDTRITMSASGYPEILQANKRSYTLYAPLVEVV